MLTLAGLVPTVQGAETFVRLNDDKVINATRVDAVEFCRMVDQAGHHFWRIEVFFTGNPKDPYSAEFTDETKAREAWNRLTTALEVK